MLLGQSGGLGGVIQHPLDTLGVGGLELLCQLRVFVNEALGGAEAGVGDHGVGAGDPLPLLFKAERPAYFAVLAHRRCDLRLDQGGVFRLAGGQQGGYLCGAGVDDLHILAHRQPGFIQEILGQSVRRCEEEYLSAACQNFEKLYGIKTKYQRLSTSEVYTKISEEAGKPSADVWFGGTTDPYNEAVADGLLMQYDAINAKNLISDNYKDPTDCWYGIYKGILGFMVNTEELDRLGLEAPKTWDDLTKEEYKGLIMLSNPNTAGTAKLLINTMVQMKGHDEAMEYFKKLDKNISQYTKSGSGPSKMVGPGECVIGIGFLHDGIYQILHRQLGVRVPHRQHHRLSARGHGALPDVCLRRRSHLMTRIQISPRRNCQIFCSGTTSGQTFCHARTAF